MKAIELTGTLDEKGQLSLDHPIENFAPSRVRIIVLCPDVTEEVETDPDDTPLEEVKASLRRAFQEAKAGQRIPLSEMWEGIDVE
ncbi:type II toxin-antitoxin system RelN family antitoxin [Coleofasciculus sp.]|uniref:type II toxin-antitoxin system RelN family antitoxin n=1 Tax=Coleofasciculus sp. TaxID=3100458 RepID=UPI003A29DDAD